MQSIAFRRITFRNKAMVVEAQAGLEDSTITALGRWINSAFNTSREQLESWVLNLAISPI